MEKATTVTRLLPRSFFLRPAERVARELLGQLLVHGPVVLRITETEAYGGPSDSASHCRFGRTPRNAPMWEEGGQAYVYLCYGLHHMLNVVTGKSGQGEAVLIRAAEVLRGQEVVRDRRGGGRLDGPGKLTQALGVDCTFNGQLLWRQGGLELRCGEPPAGILLGARVGIRYASLRDREALLRFTAINE